MTFAAAEPEPARSIARLFLLQTSCSRAAAGPITRERRLGVTSFGRGGSPALERLATSAYGDLETLPLRLAADPDRVRLVAKFAHETATAAHSGDAIAARIWREAADHLAEAVAAACRRIGLSDEEIEVSWTGRLFCAGALLTEPFAAGVTERLPAATLRAPAGGSLDGALGLAALSRMPALHPLVTSAAAA